MENKEVVQKLIEYYRKQDIEVIYRTLANCQIDYNRLDAIELLPQEERTMLLTRIKFNAVALRKFIREGDNGQPLKLTNIEDL